MTIASSTVGAVAQVRADERNLVEAELGEEAELVRQGREDGRDVHQALVIGDEDVGGVRVELLDAFGADADQAGGEQRSAPELREFVLRGCRG